MSLYALRAASPLEKPEPVREPSGLSVVSPEEDCEQDTEPEPEPFVPALGAALAEGLAHPVGGEVVVRSGELIGRIYLYKGAIAWVNCSGLSLRLRDTLLESSGIDAEELDAALREAQQLRQHFAETLLAWGLVDRAQLWECLRLHNGRHLRAVAELREDPQVLFVPLVRTYSAGLVFTLEQLLEEAAPRVPPAESSEEAGLEPEPEPVSVAGCALERSEAGHANVGERLSRLLPSMVLSAALFDREARHLCGHLFRLQELGMGKGELSQWLQELVEQRSEAHGSPREVLLVAEDTIHVLCRSEQSPSLYLWMMCDASASVGRVLAYGRLAIKSLEQELLGARPEPA